MTRKGVFKIWNLNTTLADKYRETFADKWNETYNAQFPHLIDIHANNIEKIVLDFKEQVCNFYIFLFLYLFLCFYINIILYFNLFFFFCFEVCFLFLHFLCVFNLLCEKIKTLNITQNKKKTQKAIAKLKENGISQSRIDIFLRNCTIARFPSIKRFQLECKRLETTFHQDLSREIEPTVAKALESTYEKAGADRGQGSFVRMRDIMRKGVKKRKDKIFKKVSHFSSFLFFFFCLSLLCVCFVCACVWVRVPCVFFLKQKEFSDFVLRVGSTSTIF